MQVVEKQWSGKDDLISEAWSRMIEKPPEIMWNLLLLTN